jgi:tellurite resistance protein TerA
MVDLSKVTLSKDAPSISLAKAGEPQGNIRVNLNWSSGAGQKKGLFSKLSGGGGNIDLDLGCLYELSDGSTGVVQAIGNSFGNLQGAPYIQLDGDDRSGTNTGGENMHINLANPAVFRRILIFAFIYEGVPNWAAANGVATIFPTTGPQIEVVLDSPVDGARTCAIALLTSTGSGVTVNREVRYINGAQRELDQAYGWGMNWVSGRK